MNHQTIAATRYIDKHLEILAEIYQHDYGKNQWFNVNDVQTWADWSQDWFCFVDCDVSEYGRQMYKRLSSIRVIPIHTAAKKPILDHSKVEWDRVGEVVRSRFGT